jgi:hypothetical protein
MRSGPTSITVTGSLRETGQPSAPVDRAGIGTRQLNGSSALRQTDLAWATDWGTDHYSSIEQDRDKWLDRLWAAYVRCGRSMRPTHYFAAVEASAIQAAEKHKVVVNERRQRASFRA